MIIISVSETRRYALCYGDAGTGQGFTVYGGRESSNSTYVVDQVERAR